MDGRSATFAALGVAVLGIVAFFLLDGVAAGIVLVVAGMLVVAIGILGWRDPGTTFAVAAAGPAGGTLDRPATRRPAVVLQPPLHDREREAVAEVPVEAPEDETPEPVSEQAPAPQPAVGEAEAVADPFGRGETDPVPDAEPETEDGGLEYAPGPEQPTMRLVGDDTGELDHVHDEPLLGHSDLVTHVRDYHETIPPEGATIQLRLLHERSHGAPHDPPVNLKTT